MPMFQEAHARPDETKKRPLTAGDAMFLAELQDILNTQDTMGNADPRFWTIAQTEEQAAPADIADYAAAVDEDGDTVARNLKQLAEWLDDGNAKGVDGCAYFNRSAKIKYQDGTSEGAYGIEDAVEKINAHCGTGLKVAHMRRVHKIVPDTLFLTHSDCEAHLQAYGYNYEPDAHAYAMTAVRSPRFEQLIKLLQEADWRALAVGCKA